MDLKDFFSLRSNLNNSCFHASPYNKNHSDFDFQLLLAFDNVGSIDFPLEFKQSSGKELFDILDTGYPSLFLVSDRFKELLLRNGFTGWKDYPINLFDKNDKPVLGYNGFSITGRCGPINYKKSKAIEKNTLVGGPILKYHIGEFIGLDNWDGSDLFLPHGNFGIKCTKMVKQELNKGKITNIRFENLAEIEIWEGVIKRFLN